MRRVFVCGSLRKGESNHHRFPGFGDRLVATGTIAGVVLKNLGDYPALFPTGRSGDRVVGEVYEISDELGQAIDQWEAGDGYAPQPVRVTSITGEVEAEAYFYGDPDSITHHPIVDGGDWARHPDHPR